MKQLITFSFLLIAVLVHTQEKNPLFGNWYVSMIGINLPDTTIYLAPQAKYEIRLGDMLEQEFHGRFYIKDPQPFYVHYGKEALTLYKTEKERRKEGQAVIVPYELSKKGQLILVESETAGISSDFGLSVYEKFTVLTKIHDSLSWNKYLFGSWNYQASTPFFDLKTGDTCRFTKAAFSEDNQLRFHMNHGSATCKIGENPAKPAVQSNGVLDGVYLRDPWFSFWYGIDFEKREIAFLGNFGMSFSIIELTDNSLVMVKQFFEL